jgi:hypothetical protein
VVWQVVAKGTDNSRVAVIEKLRHSNETSVVEGRKTPHRGVLRKDLIQRFDG